MPSLDRRHFLSAAAATAVCTLARPSWADTPASPSFVIEPSKPIAHIPADFTGLSYESSQLAHPHFFSASNTELVSYFRTLGDTGVLRLGGNLSEFTVWSPTDGPESPDDKGVEGPDPGKRTERTFVISPRAIRNLNAFLEATNWKLIYGLNLARGTADSAAEEAACVSTVCGPRLLAFQFGNEPDLFRHKDTREPWKYSEFIAKWKSFQQAIEVKVPNAPLAGPDTSFRQDWVGNFAADTKGKAFLLTAHYYAEGPPTNPDMTIGRLLTNRKGFSSQIMGAIALAQKSNMPYRMSEGNSCYNAGKKGVSDTFASALWAGDFLAEVAAVGATGVNLHGGGNGLYTPIAGSPAEGFSARPDYYGMLFVRPILGATMLQASLTAPDLNITAYAVQKHGKVTVLAFNKSEKDTVLTVQLPPGYTGSTANITRLTGPSIEATSGVKLGGAQVTPDGTWRSASQETASSRKGVLLLKLPAYSAASASFS